MNKLLQIIIILQIIVNGNRIVKPDPDVSLSALPFQNIKISVNEEYKYYFDNPNIYGVDLYNIGEDQEFKIKFYKTFKNGQEQDDSIFEGHSTCFPLDRYLHVKQILSLEIFPDTSQVYFTDIVTRPQSQSVYLVEENFRVHQVDFTFDQERLLSASALGNKVVNAGFFIREKNVLASSMYQGNSRLIQISPSSTNIVLITGGGAIVFDIKNNDIRFASYIELKYREHLTNVLLDGKYLYVSAGFDGLDIYSVNEDDEKVSISFISTITFDQIPGINQCNFLDVKKDENTLIILDEKNGIFFFEQNDKQNKYLFNIHFPRAKAFASYKNTFMVVAETVNGIEYVSEIFVNLLNKNYYFNRVFIEDTTFTSIEMTPTYAILISEDQHIIIEHSIFNGFVRQTNEFVTSFEEEELVKFEFYKQIKKLLQNKNEYVDYYVGLAKGDLKVFEVIHKNPGLYCTFQYAGQWQFKAILNSTQCTQLSNQEKNLFHQCQLTQNFVIDVQSSFVETDRLVLIIVSVICGLVVFFGLIISIFCCSKKWKHRLQELQRILQERKYNQLGESDQSIQQLKSNNP